MHAKVKKKKSGNMHTTTKANCAPLPHKSAWKVMSQNQGFQSLIGELLFKYCPLIAMGSMFGDRETERAIPDDKQPLVSCFLPSIMLIWLINLKQQKLPKTCLGYSCSGILGILEREETEIAICLIFLPHVYIYTFFATG